MTDKIPEKMYLQWRDGGPSRDATWCEDKLNDDDIEYILSEKHNVLIEATKLLVDACVKADALMAKVYDLGIVVPDIQKEEAWDAIVEAISHAEKALGIDIELGGDK